jgi:hypothetical protein
MKTKRINSNYPVRLAESCDCKDCRSESQVANLVIFFLTIAVVGLWFLFAK